MQTLVCIDDTDCLGSRGTGHLAAILADDIEERGWGKCFAITRHQLFVHPDIPYTSHNSAMCFAVDLDELMLDSFIDYGSVFLRRESAEGSDPGFCVVVPERLGRPEMLVKFGYKAKKVVHMIWRGSWASTCPSTAAPVAVSSGRWPVPACA